MATAAATITMTMREVDRLKTVQAVVGRMLRVGQAAQRLGMSRRQVERLVDRYVDEGPSGLASRRRGRPSNTNWPRVLPVVPSRSFAIPDCRHRDDAHDQEESARFPSRPQLVRSIEVLLIGLLNSRRPPGFTGLRVATATEPAKVPAHSGATRVFTQFVVSGSSVSAICPINRSL